jgi:hypothetical protein
VNKARRKVIAAAASVCGVIAILGAGSGSADAATHPGYPTAQVEVGASARVWPYVLNSDYWGYVLPNPGSTNWVQTASVKCWEYGSWVTGNYYGNKWFLVLVWESYDGYPVPRWLFVHGSYVFNQPKVGYCPAGTT